MQIRLNKTIRNILILIGALLAIVLFITNFTLEKVEKKVREDIGDALETVVRSTHEAHLFWIEGYKYYLKQISINPELRKLVVAILTLPNTKQELINSPQLKKLRIFFDANRVQSKDNGFFIISQDSINIASMLDNRIGAKNLIAEKRPDLLKKVFNGETVFVLPLQSDEPLQSQSGNRPPTMFFATPIKSKDKVLAVLALRIDPSQDFTRVTQMGRIGKSGETYAFDQTGLLISNSRFNDHLHHVGLIQADEEGILNVRICDPGGNMLEGYTAPITRTQQPLTVMAKSAVSGEEGVNVKGYRDYRGVTVLGAWLWDSDLGYGLATEIDESEALDTFYTVKIVVFGLITISIFISLSLAFIIYWFERKAHIAEKKQLRGLLPICSSCKKIRDDKGYWNQIESYIHEHSNTEFSHGICPECIKKLYPAHYQKYFPNTSEE